MHGRTPTFSLVLPLYNPGTGLRHTLAALDAFTRAQAAWEILFVCDGCTDGSREALEQWRTTRPGVRVLSYALNRGKGFAVRQGLAAAHGAWRLFTDVDLAYPLTDVLRLGETLQAGAEVAIASRAHPDSRLILPAEQLSSTLRRHWQGRLFAALAHRLLPLKQKDTQAGLKGLSAAAARQLLPHLRCDGFGFDCELLTACARLGVHATEVPVHVRYEGQPSTTNWKSSVRMLRELWRIRRQWRTIPAPVDVPLAGLLEAA